MSAAPVAGQPHRERRPGRVIPDLVNRDFTADAPGEKMVGDITYIPTGKGGCTWPPSSTATPRRSSASRWMTTTRHRSSIRPSRWPPAINLLPTARFSTPTGQQLHVRPVRHGPREHGVRQSVGRTGICYDNSMAESFFATLKNERVHRTQYPTREHARRNGWYIELDNRESDRIRKKKSKEI